MDMKITISELKKIIRDTISECYGWPTETEKPLYGIKSNLGKSGQYDGKNSPLKYPRGKNSRNRVNESFSKITAKELSEWQSGNWGFLQEDAMTSEICEYCGGMKVENTNTVLPEGMYECACG